MKTERKEFYLRATLLPHSYPWVSFGPGSAWGYGQTWRKQVASLTRDALETPLGEAGC